MAKSTNGLGVAGNVGREKVINSGQRKTVGTSIYGIRADTPSSSEFRSGMLEAKPGVDKGDAVLGNKPAKGRKQNLVMGTMGARYTISPNMHARGGFLAQDVQGQSRIIPSAMGSRKNFGAAGTYGSMG